MSEKSGEKYVNIVFENGMGRVEGPLMTLQNGEEIFIVLMRLYSCDMFLLTLRIQSPHR